MKKYFLYQSGRYGHFQNSQQQNVQIATIVKQNKQKKKYILLLTIKYDVKTHVNTQLTTMYINI